MLNELILDELKLGEKRLDQLQGAVTKVNLSDKEHLLTDGETCSFVGFVQTGILRSYVLKESNEFNIDFYLPRSIVSAYRSFLHQSPTEANFQALSETSVYMLNYEDYNNLLEQSVEWYKLGKYISDTLFAKKCIRETSLLTNSARERYNLLLQTYPNIEQLVPQYHIALYLGIKPESLSRIKSLTYINES